MVSDKAFKVIVIALLVLILGAVLGGLTSIYVPLHEEFLELDDELALLKEDALFYHYDVYSYEEFGNLIGRNISSSEQFLVYATENNFETTQEEDTIELYRETACETDPAGRTLCAEETITLVHEEAVIEYTTEAFREDE